MSLWLCWFAMMLGNAKMERVWLGNMKIVISKLDIIEIWLGIIEIVNLLLVGHDQGRGIHVGIYSGQTAAG